MIKNEKQFLTHIDAENRVGGKRNVYKYTGCGAWIEFEGDGIRVGSIVEGCDFGTIIYKLTYPFEAGTYDRCIQAIEAEASALWDWANEDHGEDDDGFAAVPEQPDVWMDYPDLEPYRDGVSS
jgi:hypothetical protein